ncbi:MULTISPECIES: glycosyltransferase family 2 protein [Lacticaseibacillus]|uniref:Glycosyltransferase n=1 Tax=Lacticaseibacillus casei DSM 20011 = JCM 1134 = ATCC 393 TaxID=1423732 RepID=A0AAD1AMP2_LACCA|nr:glycosyltransferase family 2 protein [Lacticaseibacillus casei]HAJ56035.1 glycosyltransferase [Lactobacillus sp.]MBI6596501.1 glycosyltransferase family 2 protein [Lacticaseibacillus casei]MBO1480192.1 glycosyltransferase family 2 protein [Lacticaseibacillus casei]MBO2415575.1 glycosyltransferase family 2 protein [Lacticaseibacillus casei]MCK2079830.1 glycosyltransferase family 2 protein [Lacticaseibacillus casei]
MRQEKDPFISIVLPVYNESAGIGETIKELANYVRARPERYELIFVNDGSTDDSADQIRAAVAKNPTIRLVDFSRNFGHQLAITAGIRYASGDAVVVMDADLQDPPRVIPEMLARWREGYDVVYGKRRKRSGETWFKKLTAETFYRVLKAVTSIDIPVDTGDFRLMDRRVVNVLKQMNEQDPYVRGMVSWVGYKQVAVEYDRQERTAGKTHYPLRKMLHLAMNGITSFSTVPLTIANWLSGFFLLIAVATTFVNLLLGRLSLLTWVISATFFVGAGVTFTIGLLGNYIGRMFAESRHRPLYIVADTYGFKTQAAQQPHYRYHALQN